MALDEKVRQYQTKGAPVTKKIDTPEGPPGTTPMERGVSVQFDDTVKKVLNHADCPGCMY